MQKANHMREQARGGILTLVLIVLVCGLALWLVWIYRADQSAHPAATGVSTPRAVALSDSTRAVLNRLKTPVEIRFYAVLAPARVSDSLLAFADRIDQLLAAYEEQSDRVTIVRHRSTSLTEAEAAVSDGIRLFNLDKGEASFLGIAVIANNQTESLPQLVPEWEQAVEFDLTRAIERLMVAKPSSGPAPFSGQSQNVTPDEVKRAIPQFDSVMVEEGTRILREQALQESREQTAQLQSQIKEAEERLNQARQNSSAAEQEAARQHLQAVRGEQAAKLKQIAARLQARIRTLKELKANSPPAR